jgi:drug/metabolite transporter (DMT)-like permease
MNKHAYGVKGMNGSILALLSASSFAASMICTRRGVLRIADASLGGYISVFVAPPLFLLIALVLGDLQSIGSFTAKGYLWLAIAGIIHFVLGRPSHYWAMKYLGANMASVFTALNLVYTMLLGFFILGEQVTKGMALGSALIIIGPILQVWPKAGEDSANARESNSSPRISAKGITAALTTGVCFGVSPLFIKWGLQQGGSALAGTFLSYSSAMVLLGATMVSTVRREAVVHMERRALLWFVLSGLFVALAQLLRYIALKVSPISVAGPLTATSPMFLLLLSFMVNRDMESFRWNVLLGAMLVVAGAAILYQ